MEGQKARTESVQATPYPKTILSVLYCPFSDGTPFKAILVAPHSIGDWTESAEKDLS
jgi:hypothetical protein